MSDPLSVWTANAIDEGTLQSTAPLVTLGDVKAFINYPNPTATGPDDAQLTQLLTAACDYIEAEIGPIAPTTYTERHDGWGGMELMLFHSPVIQINYVNEWWSTGGLHVLAESTPQNTIDGYQAEYETGRLVRVFQGNWPRTWFPGSRNVEVQYVSGRSPIPPRAQLACLELVAHWWQTDHQARARGIGGGLSMDADEEPISVAGQWIGVPSKVIDKIKSLRIPVLG